MIMNKELFSVSRGEYADFFKGLKISMVDIINENTESFMETTTYSKKSRKKLCSRICYKDMETPEEYYIFEIPDAEESVEYIPGVKVTLTSKEQVQKVLEYISAERKKQENAGIMD